MPANRRRHANVVPLASIATWILVAAFICAAGLYYVYCKNQLHALGREITALEKELQLLLHQNEGVKSKIQLLSATEKLKQRLNDGFVKLVPIEYENVHRIDHIANRASSADALRPVSNERRND